jgi:hypothetical protein
MVIPSLGRLGQGDCETLSGQPGLLSETLSQPTNKGGGGKRNRESIIWTAL